MPPEMVPAGEPPAAVDASPPTASHQMEAAPLTLADLPHDVPESTIGGQTTCIVCFTNQKTHIAVPCGHQCLCSSCSDKLERCPYCNGEVVMWMQARIV